MTPREYIETAMKLADEIVAAAAREGFIPGGFKKAQDALETHLREHLDEIIEEAYDKALEDRDYDRDES
jgi:hypothetical protein